jgi:hypothetical protein
MKDVVDVFLKFRNKDVVIPLDVNTNKIII